MTTMKSLIYFSKFTVLSENKNSTLPSSSLRSLVLHFAGCKVENKKACEGQKWLEPVWPVTNLINILWAQIMILESWYVQISSQYDSRVINYNSKVLYKIDQRLGNFGDFLPTNFVDFFTTLETSLLNCCVHLFGQLLENLATFYSNMWSHWLELISLTNFSSVVRRNKALGLAVVSHAASLSQLKCLILSKTYLCYSTICLWHWFLDPRGYGVWLNVRNGLNGLQFAAHNGRSRPHM